MFFRSPTTATCRFRRESVLLLHMFYYVYILISEKDRKFYIGKTKNLKERLKKHLKGEVVATKNRLPVRLIYYEAYTNKEKWSIQEKYYKSGIGRETLKHKI